MQNQINISPLLTDLLNLSPNTNQKDISKLERIGGMFSNNRDEVRRSLRRRIKEWNIVLDDQYEKSKSDPELLKHLKDLASKIFLGEKTNLLRNIIHKEGFSNEHSFEKAIKRTEIMVERIMNGKNYIEVVQSELNLTGKKITPTMANISKELFASVPSSQPMAINLEEIMRGSAHMDVTGALLRSRVESLSPEKDDAWLRKLIPTLEGIEDQTTFDNTLYKLNYHQILTLIIDFARANKGNMVLKIMKAAKDLILLDCLKEFSTQEIEAIKKVIYEAKDKMLLQSTLAYIREILVSKANAFTPKIDLLAKTLRDLNQKDKITKELINSINDFKKPIQELQAINVKFLLLINKEVIVDTITINMPEKIRMTCEDRLARVTNDAVSRQKRDNLHAILCELAYGEIDEEDDITGVVGMLGLREMEHFIKLGLRIDPIPEKKKDDPNASNDLTQETTNRNCEIYKQFKEIGLETIGDLINKNIYNYAQLQEYIRNANKPVSIPSSQLKS